MLIRNKVIVKRYFYYLFYLKWWKKITHFYFNCHCLLFPKCDENKKNILSKQKKNINKKRIFLVTKHIFFSKIEFIVFHLNMYFNYKRTEKKIFAQHCAGKITISSIIKKIILSLKFLFLYFGLGKLAVYGMILIFFI